MAAGYLPHATALLLATAVALLLVAISAVPMAAAAAADKYSGRMVIIRAPGASRVVVSAGSVLDKWQRRRLVEDEVAPELGGGLLGAGISNRAFEPNKAVCVPKCANPGQRYTPGHCTYKNQCSQGPTAEHTRTMQG